MIMGWGDSVSTEMNNNRAKAPLPAVASADKALGKFGSRSVDSSESLIRKPAVELDMGEASREQGFRLNGCR
jgi:hypothetical protein